MSDREIIIKSLEKVERRIRTNRLFHELTFALALFLVFPLAFKGVDLITPFRATTITVVFAVWIVAFAAYLVWRLLQKETLRQVAAAIDSKAGLHDEIKTAYWFINNPRSSEWVDVQIQRAAQNAQRLDVDRLYPRAIPKTSYIAAAMVLLFVALNFIPLPWNHNWLTLQAAPAYPLTDREQSILKQTKELLAKAEKMQQSELAQRLEDIMQQLQQGKIDAAQALQQLQQIQNMLDEGNLDMGSISEGLEEMGKDLQKSDELKEAGQAMLDKQLKQAADEMRKLAEQLGMNTPEQMKQMQQSLQQASENSRPGLEDLAKNMKDAADKLKNQDPKAAQEALDKAAQDLDNLQDKMAAQQLKNQASQQLQNLEESIRQRQQQSQQAQQNSKQQQQQGDPQKAQQGQQQGGQQGQQEDEQGGAQQSASAEGQQGQAGQQAPPGQQGQPQEGSQGKGQNPSGSPGGNAPREGAPTKLDVKLEQEKLNGMQDQGTKPEEIEEASKAERSKLDYRNVKSDLSPAQKDLLNQDKIPWEYRPLIKNYFQAIRPPVKK